MNQSVKLKGKVCNYEITECPHLPMCPGSLRNVICILLFLYYLSMISHMYKVSVKVDLEPFPGTLDMRWEYTLDGTTTYRMSPCTNAGTHSPEGLAAFPVLLDLVLQGCRVTLAKAVDVQNGHQVVQLIEGSKGHGLPH